MANDATNYVCILCGEWSDERIGRRGPGWIVGLVIDKVVNCAMSVQGLPPGLAGSLLLLVAARGLHKERQS